MPIAIFGITDSSLNLVVSLLVLFLVVAWVALVWWTFQDARRRTKDPVLVFSATAASLFPFAGTLVYSIVRPPEYMTDVEERELEVLAARLRVRHLQEQSCPRCQHPIERMFLRCPECHTRVKDPCPSCSKPVDRRWSLCPYCETRLRREGEAEGGRQRRPQQAAGQQRKPAAPAGRSEDTKPEDKPAAPKRRRAAKKSPETS